MIHLNIKISVHIYLRQLYVLNDDINVQNTFHTSTSAWLIVVMAYISHNMPTVIIFRKKQFCLHVQLQTLRLKITQI